MTKPRSRRRSSIQLAPKDEELKARRSKLPVFNPHNVGSLLAEAKTNGEVTLEAFSLAFRRRNDAQVRQLLQRLGVDPSSSDAWKRGFFHLARIHHGVGHLAWYPRRTNRNSATWTSDHDFALLSEVSILRKQGLSERAALKTLAADPKKRELFPYRRKGFSKGTEAENRANALRERLKTLKGSARKKSIEDVLMGTSRDGSSIDFDLYELTIGRSLPRIGKNQKALKEAGS